MAVLHWFRSDLRVQDNTALSAAGKVAQGELLTLYIATPGQWRQHDDAPVKQDYWRRNLQSLEQSLAARGIPLLFAEVTDYQDIPRLLETLLPALQVKQLHCNREYPLNEQQRDSAVNTLCKQLGISMRVHDDQTLLAPEQIENKSGKPFKVFTPFSRVVRAALSDINMLPCASPEQQLLPVLPAVQGCCTLPELRWPAIEAQWQQYWPAGEDYALDKLTEFADSRAADYKLHRDFPAVAGTSQLSPQLAAGALSVRQCWRASLGVAEGEGVLTWQNELIWRDFYKHVMWHFPHVCRAQNWRPDLEFLPWRHDQQEYQRWCQGQTGIPIIDAAMRQLHHTGWMHNRLRMITAMFLSKHLLLDWRLGERWFMQHLVDGDFSANNGGWQWSASTGTDAVPYFRIFNPVTQSRRFDPEGVFIRRWLPELAELDTAALHDPGLLKPQNYPAPMVDLKLGRQRALQAFKTPESDLPFKM